MLYTGYFKDINEHQYKVTLITNNSSAIVKNIILSDEPCIISQQSDGIFSPIKSRSCTINIISDIEDNYSDLYTIYNHGIPVTIYEAIDDTISIDTANNSNIVFFGYSAPCVYNQSWVGVDDISIEVIDAISTLKNIKYTTVQADAGVENPRADFVKIDNLISRLLIKAGLSGTFYYPTTIKMSNNTSSKVLSFAKLAESNFFDDDDERTPWSCYEVLEEICKYFGWTLIPYNNTVYFIDYEKLNGYYNYYNNGTTTSNTFLGSVQSILSTDYFGDDANFSYEDVHSKITISQNAYDVEDLIRDPFDPVLLDCVTTKEGLGAVSSKWTQSKTEWFKTVTTTKGFDFCTFYELKPESGWTHTYYKYGIMTDEEVPTYKDGNYGSALWKPNQILNTKGALIEKFTGYKGDENTIKPTSLGWNSCIAFFCFNDSFPNYSRYYQQSPVLTYKSSEKLRYSPVSNDDTTWIMLTGDIWYQTYAESNNGTWNVWNDSQKMYSISPAENSDVSAVDMTGRIFSPHGNSSQGWDIMKYRLRIGDKYWNGSNWTTTDSTFNVSYGNVDGNSYKISMFQWISPVYNHNYTNKVGEDCWAIPITSADNLSGDFQLDIYTPDILIPTLDSEKWHSTPVVYLKDFSLGVKFVDQVLWYVSDDETNTDTDIVFSGQNDDVDVVAEDLDTRLKINSFINEDGLQSRLSRSHVLTDNSYFGKTSVNNSSYDYQENNLVNKYLTHFGNIKQIYEATIRDRHNPYDYFRINALDNTNNFIIDAYDWNLRTGENKIKFIEY